MDDVALEQVDPFVDCHVGQFGRGQIGKRLPGRVDRRPLLLLEDRAGDVANRHDRAYAAGEIGGREGPRGMNGVEPGGGLEDRLRSPACQQRLVERRRFSWPVFRRRAG